MLFNCIKVRLKRTSTREDARAEQAILRKSMMESCTAEDTDTCVSRRCPRREKSHGRSRTIQRRLSGLSRYQIEVMELCSTENMLCDICYSWLCCHSLCRSVRLSLIGPRVRSCQLSRPTRRKSSTIRSAIGAYSAKLCCQNAKYATARVLPTAAPAIT